MGLHAWLVVLLFGSLALAGCGHDDNEGSSSPSTTSSGSRSGTSTGPAPNAAPLGTMAVLINGTSATFNLTGTDADGDALTWILSFGDGDQTNGTALPTQVNHAYTPGNYSANFTLSDGKTNKSYLLNLTAVAGGRATVTFTGGSLLPDPFAAVGDTCILALADILRTELFGNVHGLPSEVEATWTFEIVPTGAHVTFTSADGNVVGGNGSSGTVGEGVDQAIACSTEPAIDYTLTLTPA